MKDEVKRLEKAYKEINTVLNKYKDITRYNIDVLIHESKLHLFGAKLKFDYGYNIDPKRLTSLDYNRFGDYMFIEMWNDNSNRMISWSDDGRQPKDELLLKISFPTGPYIFSYKNNRDYPKEIFDKFFNELKSFKPKYTDTTNNNLYYSIENGARVFNSLNNIINKYEKLYAKEYNKEKLKKMEEDIKKLKKELENN